MGAIVGTSLHRLLTVDPRLRRVVERANSIMEVSVLCGVRSKEDQDEAFNAGKSKVKWPDSNHNLRPGIDEFSRAVDIIPYFNSGKSRYDWEDELAFARLAGVMFACARDEDVKIRWGGDWDRDNRSADERFLDLPHFELDEG